MKASLKAYKRRITLWGLDMKNKRAEVLTMLREQRQRSLHDRPPCLSVLRGKLVGLSDLERYRRRAKLDKLDPLDEEAGEAEDVCEPGYTAKNLAENVVCIPVTQNAAASLQDPTRFRVLRRLLHSIGVLVESSFDSAKWRSTNDDQWIFSTPNNSVQDANTLSRMWTLHVGGSLLDEQTLQGSVCKEHSIISRI